MNKNVDTLVYIISSKGPYPEKAYGQCFYMSHRKANIAATNASIRRAPIKYKVYTMMMSYFSTMAAPPV